MKINTKILIASHLALLVAGVFIGFSLQKEPNVTGGKPTVQYLPKPKLDLPKFNGPSLTPVSRIYFLPGPKVKPERDTVYVPMPTSYSNDFLVTQREPITKSDGDLQFKYYDPQMDKQVIDTYSIEPSPWKLGAHIDIDTPINALRPKIGPKIELGYKAVKFNIKAQLDVMKPAASQVTAGTSIRLFGNN